MNLGKLWRTVEDGGNWHAVVYGLQRIGHYLANEQQENINKNTVHLIITENF